MILNQAQATATYRAMCEMNNVNARIKVTFDEVDALNFTNVFEDLTGRITVNFVRNARATQREIHNSQDEFKTAYGVE